jgi:hypothetical protein
MSYSFKKIDMIVSTSQKIRDKLPLKSMWDLALFKSTIDLNLN